MDGGADSLTCAFGGPESHHDAMVDCRSRRDDAARDAIFTSFANRDLGGRRLRRGLRPVPISTPGRSRKRSRPPSVPIVRRFRLIVVLSRLLLRRENQLLFAE